MDRVRLAGLYGVDVTYRPAPETEIAVPEDTVVAVLAALGVDASTPAPSRTPWPRTSSAPRTVCSAPAR